jgi:type IV pilus assembly protein PilE
MRKVWGGFTLIELMVTVAIVATLATIAVTSYRKYVMRANRTEARNALLAMASAQEKYYLQNNTYAVDMADAPPTGLGIATPTPSGWYRLTLTGVGGLPTPDATGFTATATAVGSQAQDADCAVFTVNSQQAQTATNSAGTDNSAVCWSK